MQLYSMEYVMDTKSDGKLLKLKRVTLDLKQEDVARMSGFTQQCISLVERGSTSNSRTIDQIYRVLQNYEDDIDQQ